MNKPFQIFLFFMGTLNGAFAQESVVQQSEPPQGLYTGITTGRFHFLDSGDRQDFKDAWLIGIKIGHDVFRYVSIEGVWKFAAHDTAFVGAQSPASFVAHQLILNLRGRYPLTNRIYVTGEMGGGLWTTNPNLEPNVSASTRWILSSGLGVEYFLRMRGMVMGIDPTLGFIRDFNGPILQLTGYLRYTF